MGRKKINHKNKNISISLPEYQSDWIAQHPDFNLSKYCQICLKDYIDNYIDLQVKKEVKDEKNVE